MCYIGVPSICTVSIASLRCESEDYHKNLLFFILKRDKTDAVIVVTRTHKNE